MEILCERVTFLEKGENPSRRKDRFWKGVKGPNVRQKSSGKIQYGKRIKLRVVDWPNCPGLAHN